MLRSLLTASSGMKAQQMQVDTIANNIANANTTGFKKNRLSFQSLYYQTYRNQGAPLGG
ncbi:MAG: flagellar basal body rod protein FlgG, partial [Planctomycetes bacterium]|nr:flagellar basal body rod protein FlgG [Planctomycetota bacterium]